MIKCKGNVREGADGRFYVSCRGEQLEMNPFTEGSYSPLVVGGTISGFDSNSNIVKQWIENNCCGSAEIYGTSTVVFEKEEDAGLFWFTFQ